MENRSTRRLLVAISYFIKERFSLDEDKADEKEIVSSIKNSVEFKGTNVWVLVFAIFIASIGLNVNSTAVIIGAMLISPLMGPIMGIGLAIGIYDFELIKRAFKNLAIATAISVITSAVYFFISPLSDAQSELLARTTPTIWDVLIALFGGLAGIVAATRKFGGNVVPGVAIATALMPPLCTAGFGIASGNFAYFFGAFYLFFINSVFISLSSFIIVRFLKFSKVTVLDPVKETKIKRYILIIVILTIIPSIVMAYNIVTRELKEKRISQFITNEFNKENIQVVSRTLNKIKGKEVLEVFVLGDILSNENIKEIKNSLGEYKLDDLEIKIKQGVGNNAIPDVASLKASVIEDLYRKNEEIINNKDKQISLLESEVKRLSSGDYPVNDISLEIKTLNKNISQFTITNSIISDLNKSKLDTLVLVYAKFNMRQSGSEIKRLNNWLVKRLKSEKIKFIVQ